AANVLSAQSRRRATHVRKRHVRSLRQPAEAMSRFLAEGDQLLQSCPRFFHGFGIATLNVRPSNRRLLCLSTQILPLASCPENLAELIEQFLVVSRFADFFIHCRNTIEPLHLLCPLDEPIDLLYTFVHAIVVALYHEQQGCEQNEPGDRRKQRFARAVVGV